MKKLLASVGLLALMLGSAQAQTTPWPGQCPAGALPTSIGCQPQAAAPVGTDLLLGWQSGQTPSTRSFQIQQLRGAGYFQASDYGVKADGVTSDDVALKAAFDACAAKGGHLLLPAGKILLTGAASITVQNCGVEGVGVLAGYGTSTASQGTMILLTSTSVKPFIIGGDWSWSGTNFFWPNQTTGLIVYPPLFSMDIPSCVWEFHHNVIVNAYDGFVQGTGTCQGESHIRDNMAYAMHDFLFSRGVGDLISVSDNEFTPGPWFNLDPNARTNYPTVSKNNTIFHIGNNPAPPLFPWNITANNNAAFAWRYAIKMDPGAVLANSDFDMVVDSVGTLVENPGGGNISGIIFHFAGNCATIAPKIVPAPPCFNLGASGNLNVQSTVLASSGSFVVTSGANVLFNGVVVTAIGDTDGTDYYGVHFTGTSGGGEQIIVQNSTFQGNSTAHTHGIKTDVPAARVVIQNTRLNFLNDMIDVQTLGTTTITGNWGTGTVGPQSVLITGTGGVQYANNNFDKGPNSTLSNCGGATDAQGAFSGFFKVGATNPTTSCTLTFPFALLSPGGGGCNFQASSNLNLWANVSGVPSVWVIQASADFHNQNVFFNCRAAQ